MAKKELFHPLLRKNTTGSLLKPDYYTNWYNKLYQLHDRINLSTEQNELVEQIFDLFPDSNIIAAEKNLKEETLLIVERISGSDIDIYLYGPSYQGICHIPRITGHIRTLHKHKRSTKYVQIDYLLMYDNNIGNGSIAMKYFISAVKKSGIFYISGHFRPENPIHAKRQQHYFEKFGFDVRFHRKKGSGNILLDLNRRYNKHSG